MKVIVDANIIFSAILNTNGKIGDLLLNSEKVIDFVAPKYVVTEVVKYHPKIKRISGKSLLNIQKIHFKITQRITLISEEQIPHENWEKANMIVRDIDPKDTPYVAFSLCLGHKIWTGDLKLRNGLLQKGFDLTITTNELFQIKNNLIKK